MLIYTILEIPSNFFIVHSGNELFDILWEYIYFTFSLTWSFFIGCRDIIVSFFFLYLRMISTVSIPIGPNSAEPQATVACEEGISLLSIILAFLMALPCDPGAPFMGFSILPVTLWWFSGIYVNSEFSLFSLWKASPSL